MRHRISNTPRTRALTSFACSVVLITCIAGQAMADDSNAQPTAYPRVKRTFSPAPAGSATTAPAAGGGLVVHLDENGRPTQNVKSARTSVDIPANNNSHEGLVVRDVKLKDGRTLKGIDLKGRFQSYAVATMGPDGKVKVGCVTPNDVATSATKECSE